MVPNYVEAALGREEPRVRAYGPEYAVERVVAALESSQVRAARRAHTLGLWLAAALAASAMAWVR